MKTVIFSLIVSSWCAILLQAADATTALRGKTFPIEGRFVYYGDEVSGDRYEWLYLPIQSGNAYKLEGMEADGTLIWNDVTDALAPLSFNPDGRYISFKGSGNFDTVISDENNFSGCVPQNLQPLKGYTRAVQRIDGPVDLVCQNDAGKEFNQTIDGSLYDIIYWEYKLAEDYLGDIRLPGMEVRGGYLRMRVDFRVNNDDIFPEHIPYIGTITYIMPRTGGPTIFTMKPTIYDRWTEEVYDFEEKFNKKTFKVMAEGVSELDAPMIKQYQYLHDQEHLDPYLELLGLEPADYQVDFTNHFVVALMMGTLPSPNGRISLEQLYKSSEPNIYYFRIDNHIPASNCDMPRGNYMPFQLIAISRITRPSYIYDGVFGDGFVVYDDNPIEVGCEEQVDLFGASIASIQSIEGNFVFYGDTNDTEHNAFEWVYVPTLTNNVYKLEGMEENGDFNWSNITDTFEKVTVDDEENTISFEGL